MRAADTVGHLVQLQDLHIDVVSPWQEDKGSERDGSNSDEDPTQNACKRHQPDCRLGLKHPKPQGNWKGLARGHTESQREQGWSSGQK